MAISSGPADCSSGLAQRIFNNLRYDNPWQASQSGVQVGTLACPTVPNGIGYKCTAITTGITGGSEPTWPLVLTNTVVDGGVTWTAQDVANPSAKAHPPAGQFGYLFTASDLDGFRLLAYNAAKGVADSLTSDQVDPFSQVASALPMAAANTAAGQSIANGATPSIVVFGTVARDTDSAYNASTGRYTIPAGKGGDYLISGVVAYTAVQTGSCTLQLFKNGATLNLWGQQVNPAAVQPITLTAVVNCAAGDILDLRTSQPAGTPQALFAGAFLNYFTLKCLSRT